MLRRLAILCVLWLVSLAPRALACQCIGSLQPCNQTAASDVVFIGTVESMEPMFLSRWNPSNQSSIQSLNEAYIEARRSPSDQSIERLKYAYRKAFPDMPADRQSRLQTAKTAAGVASLFYSGLGQGMHVRFHVKTLFKREDDDDDAAKKNPQPSEDCRKPAKTSPTSSFIRTGRRPAGSKASPPPTSFIA